MHVLDLVFVVFYLLIWIKSMRSLSATQSKSLLDFGGLNESNATVPIAAFLQNNPGLRRQTELESMERANGPKFDGEMIKSGVKGNSN